MTPSYPNPHDGPDRSNPTSTEAGADGSPSLSLEQGMKWLQNGLEPTREAVMAAEAQLKTDVDALRAKGLKTRELYREVCRLLFFKYCEHPTPKRLYDLLGVGTKSVPGEELSKFWSEVRLEALGHLSMPRVPEALQSSVENFVLQLWSAAQKSAKDSLDQHYKAAELAVNEANARAQFEASQNEQLREQVASLTTSLSAQKDAAAALERQLAEKSSEWANVRSELIEVRGDLGAANRLNAEIIELRRMDAVEAAQALEKAEGRFRDSEKRLYMEVDRERERAKDAFNALQKHREEGARAEAAHRTETSNLYREIGDLKQSVGAADAKLNAAERRNRELEVQIRQLSDEVRTTTTESAELRAELDATRTDRKETQKRLDHAVADNMDMKALNSKLEAKVKELENKLAKDSSS